MKPPPFDYVAPRSLDEALEQLAAAGDDAKVIAGGQSLIPLLALRLARPTLLVDLNGIDELSGISQDGDVLTIGAMTRHRVVERSVEVARAAPLVAEAMPHIGHVAIRSRGTFGGSLAHADPAAELPAVAIALGATFTATSAARGARSVPAADFFRSYFTSALEPDEILTAVHLPVRTAATGYRLEEVARRHGDFAMVGVAAAVTVTDGTITSARIALLNVAETPVRATAAETAIAGQSATPATPAAFAAAAEHAADGLEPPSDLHASAAYRRHVARTCVERALATATRRAQEAS